MMTWEEAAAAEMAKVGTAPTSSLPNLHNVEYWLTAAKNVVDANEGWGVIGSYFQWIAALSLDECGRYRNAPLKRKLAKQHVLETIASKQHDYGHDNITWAGLMGVIIRMHDKIARIKNLDERARRTLDYGPGPINESLLDSWLDLVGYSIIALMLIEGTFELNLAADQPKENIMEPLPPAEIEDANPSPNVLLEDGGPDQQLLDDCDDFPRYADLMAGFQRLIAVGQYKFGWSPNCTIDIKPWGPAQPTTVMDSNQEAPSE